MVYISAQKQTLINNITKDDGKKDRHGHNKAK